MRPETIQIQSFIKQFLKDNGLLYKDIAHKMKVSESTFKRMLNNDDITLSKLIELCNCLDINFFELMERSAHQKSESYCFSEEQEKYLSKDFNHFKAFRLLVLSKKLESIQSELSLNHNELQTILKNLEKVKLIERWENNRIKLLATFPFKWNKNGPLEKSYVHYISDVTSSKLKEGGINGTDDRTHSRTIVSEFFLDEKSQTSFQKDIEEIFERYRSTSKINISSKNKNASFFSFLYIGGNFSWWSRS